MGTSLKRKQTKKMGLKAVLLGAFLFSVFSSTSFAKEVQKLKETSCGSKAKPVYFNGSGAGLKDMQMGLLDGEFGPEFQIGKTRIFFAPGEFDPTQASKPGQDKNGSFYVIDGPNAKADEKGKAIGSYSAFPSDSSSGEPPKNGDKMFGKPMKINQNGEEAKVELWKTYKDGKQVGQFILIKGSESKNSIRIDISNKSKDKNVDIKMSVQAKPTDGGKCGISGIIETHVQGKKNEAQNQQGNDSHKVIGCKNTKTGTDFSKNPKNDSEQKATVDLDGIDFVMGKNQAPTNQFQCDQRIPETAEEAKGSPSPPIARQQLAGAVR